MPIQVKLPGIARFRDYLSRRPEPVRRALLEWANIYEAFTKERFVRFSRGQGNWAPIKDSTAKRKGSTLILRDTDTMFTNLAPKLKSLQGVNTKGAQIKMVIEAGGGAVYSNGVSVGEVIEFHQEGTAHMPARKIFVPPDSKTRALMASRLKKGVVEAISE